MRADEVRWKTYGMWKAERREEELPIQDKANTSYPESHLILLELISSHLITQSTQKAFLKPYLLTQWKQGKGRHLHHLHKTIPIRMTFEKWDLMYRTFSHKMELSVSTLFWNIWESADMKWNLALGSSSCCSLSQENWSNILVCIPQTQQSRGAEACPDKYQGLGWQREKKLRDGWRMSMGVEGIL